MTPVLSVKGLCKDYGGFKLENISFDVNAGEINGFIGRNGAGKTTAIRSILNFTSPQSGEIYFFGMPYRENEKEIKQRIGYASGGVDYYKRKKIKDIIAVTKVFYENWDDTEYKKYLKLFSLDENKKPIELSEGMKVKLNLTIALSHHAELLILDEPTSGLDPVSRDELLEIFVKLQKTGVAILFSTHITSDLDKSADKITYIKKGKLISSMDKEEFTDSYRILNITEKESEEQINAFSGTRIFKNSKTALIRKENAYLFDGYELSVPTLEEIMLSLEKEELL